MSAESETIAETHPFQAEVAELLRLMVHAVYSETDVFLRELISNGSDACDKLRYEAIANQGLLADGAALAIRIKPDAEAGTLTIADTGIGMDRQELIDNLGTVARSGTRAFMSRLAEANEGAGLIGQFGVGFYAAFMVADRIEVVSRRAGASEAWVWRSSGGGGFDIVPASKEQAERVPRGTEIVLHVKEDSDKSVDAVAREEHQGVDGTARQDGRKRPDALGGLSRERPDVLRGLSRYLEPGEIERIVRTYSDHILFPIELIGKEGAPRQINTASALWQRSKSDLKAEDYAQAYRAITGAFDEPAMTLHYKAEGRQSYAVLLFVPSRPPFDLFDPARASHVKLYVRRVYITDDAALLPSYLRFLRGVVDSEDMPLNISREMLQNNPQVAQIRNALTGRVITELENLAAKDAETFAKIWEAFGKVLKEGIYEDRERRDLLLALARFATTAGDGTRTLKQYVADLKPNQTEIYYLVGESAERLKSNPKLEAARARGIEVLLLTDPIDAFWTATALDFEGKPLKSLSQGEVDFGLVSLLDQASAPDSTPTSGAVDEATVIAAVMAALGERVSEVRASQRLTDSPACLVAVGRGPDRELERLLARQNRSAGAKPIIELNMRHPLLKALSRAKADAREDEVADLSVLLFDEAKILDGEVPDDPAAFAARLNRLVMRGLPMSN